VVANDRVEGLLLEYAQWFDLDGVDEIVTLQEATRR